ncbi:MAG TPA: hypothetical protein VEY70_19100, partial [Metabacillus sp.]|nr:hypothetical protein [Metabacillus sp.]
MKEKNRYTWALFMTGVLSVLYTYSQIFYIGKWPEFLIILAFLIFLDVFPIKLPSGDQYNVGTVCFLYLLFEFNWNTGVLA